MLRFLIFVIGVLALLTVPFILAFYIAEHIDLSSRFFNITIWILVSLGTLVFLYYKSETIQILLLRLAGFMSL